MKPQLLIGAATSGSGKTTLLNLLAALDKPTGGQVRLNGKNLGELKEKEIAGFRRENLGFVFQDFNLLDTFSLRDNIYLAARAGREKKYEEDESFGQSRLRKNSASPRSSINTHMRCPADRSSVQPLRVR